VTRKSVLGVMAARVRQFAAEGPVLPHLLAQWARPRIVEQHTEDAMQVRDVMTMKVASVWSDEPLSRAAQLMWERDCGSLPVQEVGSGRIIGMLTDRDICMATWSRDQAPGSISVGDVMSRELYSVSPDDSIQATESLMRAKQVRRVPVLDAERQLIGIVSLADIATEASRAGSRAATTEVAPEAITATLADIVRRQARPVNGEART
jgi:predicted transcriptional regulator